MLNTFCFEHFLVSHSHTLSVFNSLNFYFPDYEKSSKEDMIDDYMMLWNVSLVAPD